MQQIIKQAGPSRQLFETVNFAFMKIFDFLVKTACLRAFLLSLGDLCPKLLPNLATELDFWPKFLTQIIQEKQIGSKNGYSS